MKGSKKILSGLWPDYLTDPRSGILIPAPPCYMPTNERGVNDNDGSWTKFLMHLSWWDKIIVGVLYVLLYNFGKFLLK